MKKLLQISIVLLSVILISSCTGNDGDPGPVGKDGAQGPTGAKGDKGDKGDNGAPGDADLKGGSISGTLAGIRKDKIAFQETFKYEYFSEQDGFNNDGFLNVSRSSEGFGRNGYVYMSLDFTDKNNPALPIAVNYLSVNFSKEISSNHLFVFDASTNSSDPEHKTTVEYPVSIENNDPYQINYQRQYNTMSNGVLYFGALTDNNSFVFYTLDDKIIHYANGGVTIGNYKKTPLLKVTDSKGNQVDPGVFAGTNFYYKISGQGSYIEDKDGKNLSGQETWDFSNNITNYHYNATTGVVTFNYSVNIPAPLNSSGHPATLSGSVEAKIYDEISSRVASGN